jgi:hypoxanthine phosphoribosyltransferase
MLTATQNKDKPKKGVLPAELMDNGRYLAARTVGDAWISYPWEAMYVSVETSCQQNVTQITS